MKERYIPIRPGILEHLLRGDISAFEFGVYVIVHLQADYRTGTWRGSAPRIIASAPRGAELRRAQRALEHLSELGLLKHFHLHGQHGNFAFLINKFTVRSGALSGMRLNADKSKSWQSPVYESCADDDAEGVAQDAPLQEVRSKREEGKKKPAAKPAPPADPRFQPFLDFAIGAFEAKHEQKPTWTGKDSKALSALLAGNKGLGAHELQRRFGNYLASTEAFTQKQGDSLAYFCARIDSFLAGPILAVSGQGSGNGKPSATELAIRNARALGPDGPIN
jgi:hypothetical protein